MANKLKLALSSAAPEGDVVTICLIGTNSTIIPHLDKTAAAGLIAAIGAAQFTGEKGKSLTLYGAAGTYLLTIPVSLLLAWVIFWGGLCAFVRHESVFHNGISFRI